MTVANRLMIAYEDISSLLRQRMATHDGNAVPTRVWAASLRGARRLDSQLNPFCYTSVRQICRHHLKRVVYPHLLNNHRCLQTPRKYSRSRLSPPCSYISISVLEATVPTFYSLVLVFQVLWMAVCWACFSLEQVREDFGFGMGLNTRIDTALVHVKTRRLIDSPLVQTRTTTIHPYASLQMRTYNVISPH